MLIVGCAPIAHAQRPAITHVADPEGAPASEWDDVLKVKPQGSLHERIAYVQDIESTGAGDVNLDYYAITIDSAGRTAQEEMAQFRRNISQYIYRGTAYNVEPLDASSAERWDSRLPEGAVMVFKLGAVPRLGLPLERGAVVVSYADASHFVFSTVSLAGALGAGDHPVSGNRAFGIQSNGDGSLTIFTKAADRRKDDNPAYTLLGSRTIFEQGAAVWRGLMSNLTEVYRDRSPRNLTQYRRSMPESEFRQMLDSAANWSFIDDYMGSAPAISKDLALAQQSRQAEAAASSQRARRNAMRSWAVNACLYLNGVSATSTGELRELEQDLQQKLKTYLLTNQVVLTRSEVGEMLSSSTLTECQRSMLELVLDAPAPLDSAWMVSRIDYLRAGGAGGEAFRSFLANAKRAIQEGTIGLVQGIAAPFVAVAEALSSPSSPASGGSERERGGSGDRGHGTPSLGSVYHGELRGVSAGRRGFD